MAVFDRDITPWLGGGEVVVPAPLLADKVHRLHYAIGALPLLPLGTFNFIGLARANANAGKARWDVRTALVNSGTATNLLTVALSAIGEADLVWGATDANKTKRHIRDIAAPVANRILIVEVVFKAAGWTLCQNSFWNFSVI